MKSVGGPHAARGLDSTALDQPCTHAHNHAPHSHIQSPQPHIHKIIRYKCAAVKDRVFISRGPSIKYVTLEGREGV